MIQDKLRLLSAEQQDFARLMAARLGVDAAGLAALYYLSDRGAATPTELARALKISTAATTLVVNRLVAAGHVGREPHPSDRRKVVVVPVQASVDAAYELVRSVAETVETLTAAMTAEERAAVESFLDRMTEAYQQAQAPLRDQHGSTGRPNDIGDGVLFTV
ncbi:MarR family winged helix-turn-helix transcriptional regulator [Actinoplanes friuliensis]|uniref:MarR family transcriptional regulator n=1 Tax=Actinoplanes friuliensis DSM 7358 TaxID=1246995 RepID=U5VRG3_9ACTN|nr:MarR family transcriptional regulator [Actinoplanes friuliensis]AGZ39407.1 MarR family transcriptional regulator [Actinoplanes friuliensis DSM 7358]